MYIIRPFTKNDFEMVQAWWKKQDELPPTLDMLPQESTFICEYNNSPLLAITVYLTNSKEFCILDNFIGNPEMTGKPRKDGSALIIEFAEQFAKDLGYRSMMCMAFKDKLKNYYQSFGYTKRFDNVATFNKELM